MPRKTLGNRVEDLSKDIRDLTIKLECHLTEFKIFKKLGYAILAGIMGILWKLYWRYIINSPEIISNVIALVNTTLP